jgi:glutaredoxin
MKPAKVQLYTKSFCGWCQDAKRWLEARGIPFEQIDIQTDGAAREKMAALSGQNCVPVMEVDGHILADFDTGQLEAFWKKLGYE